MDEKKKLLEVLLDIVKSYSDNIEKDSYLKEISRLLNIKESIIYDSFNKIRFKNARISQNNENLTLNNWKVNGFFSSDLVIAYCLFDDKNINFIKEKILFPNSI
ncbi:MAG: hypothetical protein LBU14_05250 [Candidatus Peribacteria bacterium]|nr:hypothetical protein [Candidatus Peribacteria bacterium]